MNKTELLDHLAGKTGQTKSEISKTLVTFLDTIVETVARGDQVQLVGFGTFEPAHRAARTGRNPSNGAVI